MSRNTEQTEHWNRCLERVGTSQDKMAFAELIKHFAPLVKAYMLKVDGITPEVAEGLAQNTMTRLWQRAPEFLTSKSSASSWIFSTDISAVTHNLLHAASGQLPSCTISRKRVLFALTCNQWVL